MAFSMRPDATKGERLTGGGSRQFGRPGDREQRRFEMAGRNNPYLPGEPAFALASRIAFLTRLCHLLDGVEPVIKLNFDRQPGARICKVTATEASWKCKWRAGAVGSFLFWEASVRACRLLASPIHRRIDGRFLAHLLRTSAAPILHWTCRRLGDILNVAT